MRLFFRFAGQSASRRKKSRRPAARRFRLHSPEDSVKGESPAFGSGARSETGRVSAAPSVAAGLSGKKPAKAADKGFNLTELATAAAVMTVISVVGISSYKTQKNKAAAADAKRYLTTVFAAEQQFYETWGVYHENLSLVGAIPVGMVTYDVGFTSKTAAIDQLSGSGIPTDTATQAYVKAEECTTWDGICGGACAAKTPTILSAGYFSCTVNFKKKDDYKIYGTMWAEIYDAEMTASTFKAAARGYLSMEDVWSINEKQEIKHEKDGTK